MIDLVNAIVNLFGTDSAPQQQDVQDLFAREDAFCKAQCQKVARKYTVLERNSRERHTHTHTHSLSLSLSCVLRRQ